VSHHQKTSPPGPTLASVPAGSARPTSNDLFHRWFASHPDKLSEHTRKVYLHTWTAYLKFLAEQSITWPEASSANIETYLSAVAPLRKDHAAASTVTQRRYWRILRDIYGYALIYQWVDTNPVLAAQHPHNEFMPSLSLPEWSTSALDHQLAEDCRESPVTWQAQRDRAMLALMLCAAPKTGELIALTSSDLSLDAPGQPLSVQLHGPRGVQLRIIKLKEGASAQIERWMQVRKDIEGRPDALFFGQKRVPGTDLRRTLTHKTVYIIVKSFLSRALPAGSFEHGLTHQGAELIRNSVIAKWLADPLQTAAGMDEVMKRAGVTDRRTIDRLVRKPIIPT
jgi:integrase/recombinase XerC